MKRIFFHLLMMGIFDFSWAVFTTNAFDVTAYSNSGSK